jgi:hypothetical protein
MADSEDKTPTYVPKAPVENASKVALKAAAVGFFVSSIQNALQKHNYGAMGVLTRTGGTIGFFGVFFYFNKMSL